jgi:3-phosphoshikimate 1-carboxyvinyltransferase
MSDNSESPESTLNHLIIVGLGLIGASIASAARKKGLARKVIGITRRSSTLELASEAGIIDSSAPSLDDINLELGLGDLVIICVPTLSVKSVLEDCRRCLSDEVTITDVASVKGSVIEATKQVYGFLPEQFVPGHPIAGSEKSGVTAADENLFLNHRVVLTPDLKTSEEHLSRVIKLWSGVGALVSNMSVEEHDGILAATSHLPHFLAYSLVDTLASLEDKRDIFRFAAGGFRDFTRIAASDPVMWRDIALANRASILDVLDKVMANFVNLRGAINSGNGKYLMDVFTRARDARNYFGKLEENKELGEYGAVKSINFRVAPGGYARGNLRVPGDKSISHRSIILGSIAMGMTEITGFLEGEDSLATLQAFRDMGVTIEGPDQGRVLVHGVGVHGLKDPKKSLYMGNSGTSIRLLSGLLAGQKFNSELTGDDSLSSRPMNRVADPLSSMGAMISTSAGGTPPLKIRGNASLRAIDYDMPLASAQVKSCLLLAGIYAQGLTSVTEPAPTRDHTERMLKGFGYDIDISNRKVTLESGGTLKGTRIDVPADISSAAFFMVAAAITPDSDIVMEHVGVNPTRIGVINILRQMGAMITLFNQRVIGGEPVADIRVQHCQLYGIDIPESQVALAIDEFPAIFIAAACADGVTNLTGAEELRVKESDRIQAMADGLSTLGIEAHPTLDGIRIVGGEIGSGRVLSHHDHRIAMAFAIAGLRAAGDIIIEDCNNVATSFPTFVDLAHSVGLQVNIETSND